MDSVPEAEQQRPLQWDLWETALIWVAEFVPLLSHSTTSACRGLKCFLLRTKSCALGHRVPKPSNVKAPGLGQVGPSDTTKDEFLQCGRWFGCQEGAESGVI